MIVVSLSYNGMESESDLEINLLGSASESDKGIESESNSEADLEIVSWSDSGSVSDREA